MPPRSAHGRRGRCPCSSSGHSPLVHTRAAKAPRSVAALAPGSRSQHESVTTLATQRLVGYSMRVTSRCCARPLTWPRTQNLTTPPVAQQAWQQHSSQWPEAKATPASLLASAVALPCRRRCTSRARPHHRRSCPCHPVPGRVRLSVRAM